MSWRRKSARLLLLSLCLFLLLEQTARVHLFGLAGLDPRRIDSLRLGGFGYVEKSSHPELGWELKPSVSGFVKLVWFETNSQRMRDREYPFQKPPGARRVAVVGSSFSMAPGVEIERTFHSLLEDALSRELAPTRYEFLNFGVGGYNAAQILAMLELRVLAFHPDLILFTTTQRSSGGMRSSAAKPERELVPPPRTYPFLRSFLAQLVSSRMGDAPSTGAAWDMQLGVLERVLMILSQGAAATEFTPPFRRVAGHPQSVVPRESVLRELQRISLSSGVPIAVVHLQADPAERTWADLDVEQKARALGIPHLDTRDAFRGMRPQDLWIYDFNSHPNASAHAIFARVIEKFLRDEGLVGS